MKKIVIDHSILRLLSILIGGVSIYLGYQLFIKGITGKASLVVNANSIEGQLLNAAPGLFFAISGVVIIIFGLLRKETIILSGGAKNKIDPTYIESIAETILKDASYSYDEKQKIKNALEAYKGAKDDSIPTFIRRSAD